MLTSGSKLTVEKSGQNFPNLSQLEELDPECLKEVPEALNIIMGLFWGTKVIRKVSSLINFKLLSFLVKKKGEKYVDFWVKTY